MCAGILWSRFIRRCSRVGSRQLADFKIIPIYEHLTINPFCQLPTAYCQLMEKDTSRIEAFSDGIFAVAITLLALDIGIDIKDVQVVHPLAVTTNSELLNLLKEEWPKIFTYFNSFAAVLLMWMAHHQIFKILRTTSLKLILINGLLLLIIALMPFPTKTLGEFLFTSAQKTAILFYTGFSVLVAGAFVLFILVAKSGNNNLFLPDTNPHKINRIARELEIGFSLNITIFIIAFFLPLPALLLNFCMWIFWAITTRSKKD